MVQFNTELFIDMLVLMLHHRDADSINLVERFIELYEHDTKDTKLANKEYLDLYVDITKTVMYGNQDTCSADTILIKYKANPVVVKDPELYTTLKSILNDTTPLSDELVEIYKKELTGILLMDNTCKYVNKIFAASRNYPRGTEGIYNALEKINNLCSELTQYNQKIMDTNNTNATIIRDVDFTDNATITKGFEVYNTVNVKNVFAMGLQGFNRALGGRGLKLGESMVINTLPYNGKSLMLLKIARWIVTLNSLSSEFKNPACIFYSLENETPQNLTQLFTEMWVSDKRELPPNNLSIEVMAEYISTTFNRYGWKFILKRRVGANFGPNELMTDFNTYVAMGYTPLAVIIDYVNLMKKNEETSRDLAVRNLYSVLCNFLKSNNCCFITAHQLNRKAAEVVRANPVGAVKKFTLDMLSDSTDPQREVDLVLYQNKEIDTLGRAWMTWKLDKHRYDTTTPEHDKYFAYMFDGPLGIMDDIEGKDMSVTNIYAAAEDMDDEDDDTLALQI